ncbi:hypothetical protein F5X68DRAFT_233588 [Plectosphaerella plurivora]|uniref:Uncharacterized protein n=1 Tax=Plectosphaerella plurivora TaxID=936078 RepID=A0A9P8V858_9PEZI|nr:hypothetical protein F5X68DRAFT_233588 [Plectosphaerella plurivora]
MPTIMKAISYFSYLSLIPLASAIDPSPIGPRQWSTVGISRKTGTSGPWDIPSEDWAYIMSEPDFERVFPINGHNVSSADGLDTIDGWTVTLSVRTEIPADDVIEISGPGADFAGSLVRLNPPESLVEQAQGESSTISLLDPKWRLCVATYQFTSLEDRLAVTMDDGSCSNIFSDECLRAMGQQRMIPSNPYVGCDLPSWPSECDSIYGSGSSRPLTGRYSTWDDDDIEWLSGSHIVSVATDTFPRGDRNATIDLVTRYTDLVVVSWLHNTTDSGNTTFSQSVVCPKALNTTDNDQDSGSDGDNSGNGGDGDGGGNGDGDGEAEGDGGNAGASLSVSLTACLLGLLMSLAL